MNGMGQSQITTNSTKLDPKLEVVNLHVSETIGTGVKVPLATICFVGGVNEVLAKKRARRRCCRWKQRMSSIRKGLTE